MPHTLQVMEDRLVFALQVIDYSNSGILPYLKKMQGRLNRSNFARGVNWTRLKAVIHPLPSVDRSLAP